MKPYKVKLKVILEVITTVDAWDEDHASEQAFEETEPMFTGGDFKLVDIEELDVTEVY